MNETLNTIYERRAVRRYKEKPVDRKLIDQVLDAARMAPSAMNRQPWKFYVMTGREKIISISNEILEKISDKFPHVKKRQEDMGLKDAIFYGAPVVIFITSPKDNEWADIDIGICCQTIMLAAKSLGLDSCPIGFARFVTQTASFSKLGISDSEKVNLAIVMGYGDEKPEIKERKKDNAFFLE